ncbi:MAG: hypothetical protein HY868_23405 [Chloroflexi bacterium]|nr:hypothetical protein [Chloroflexota bacterium]
MKRIAFRVEHLRSFLKGVLAGGVVVVGFVLLLPRVTVYAQSGLSDDELFNRAYNFYPTNCVDAALYLKAYMERNPVRMAQSSEHAKEVYDALAYCVGRLNEAVDDAEQLKQCRAQSAQAGVKQSGLTVNPPTLRASTAPPVKSYPLVCRGGDNLVFTYLSSSPFLPKPQLQIAFDKATYRAGYQREYIGSFQAGQCAWLDRSVASSEPDKILFADPVVQTDGFGIIWRDWRVQSVGFGHLASLQSSGKYGQFDVYNDQRGHFIATAIQYCTPGPDQAAFFVDWDYKGQCVVKDIGRYDNAEQMGIPNDTLSSVKVGANVRVVICMHGGQTDCVRVDDDNPNLSKSYLGPYSMNDQVTSFRVEKR